MGFWTQYPKGISDKLLLFPCRAEVMLVRDDHYIEKTGGFFEGMFLQGPSKTGSKNGFLRSMPAKYTRARRGACLHHEARHDNKYTCICPSCRRVSSPCMHDRILSSQPRLIRADRSTNAVTCLPSRQQFGGLSELLIYAREMVERRCHLASGRKGTWFVPVVTVL